MTETAKIFFSMSYGKTACILKLHWFSLMFQHDLIQASTEAKANNFSETYYQESEQHYAGLHSFKLHSMKKYILLK